MITNEMSDSWYKFLLEASQETIKYQELIQKRRSELKKLFGQEILDEYPDPELIGGQTVIAAFRAFAPQIAKNLGLDTKNKDNCQLHVDISFHEDSFRKTGGTSVLSLFMIAMIKKPDLDIEECLDLAFALRMGE